MVIRYKRRLFSGVSRKKAWVYSGVYLFFGKTDRQLSQDKNIFRPYMKDICGEQERKNKHFGKVHNIKDKSKATKKDTVHFAAFEE